MAIDEGDQGRGEQKEKKREGRLNQVDSGPHFEFYGQMDCELAVS